MFSDYLRILDQAPAKTLLFIAALLVIVCQLVAMVLVAGAQVEKAELREARYASARATIIGCMKSSQGAALKDCAGPPAIFSTEADAGQTITPPQGLVLLTSSDRY